MRYTKIASLTAAAFLAMAASTAWAQEGNHDIRIVLPEQPGNLEPCGTIITTVGQVLSQNVTEPLATVNAKTGQPEPKLATKWEQLDPTTWRFNLRKGVKFQDGADFNAKAVAFSIDRMTSGKLTCNNMAKFGNAKLTVTPVDDYTVDIKSDKPQPILPTLLSVVMMVSPNTPADKAVNDPVGTGPFKLASFTPQNVVLEAFSDYWGDKPAVTKATYVWRQESSIRAAMIETGEADLTPAIAIQDANNPDTDFAYLNSETTAMRIDAEQPPLDDIRLRKALNLAIDWDGLSQLFGEDAPRASQMVVEGIVGHDKNLKPWPYDLERAKSLIAEAKKDGVKVDTEIRLIGRNGIYPNGAEAMEAMMMMWQEAGLNVKLVMLDVADWLRYLQKPYPEDRGPTLLQSMHDNNKGDAAFTIPIFYRSTGQYSVLNSPEMDAEIDAAMAATGAEREKAFQKIFDEALNKYVTDIPMYHMIGYTRVGKRLEWKPDISTNSEIPLANIRFKQ
ncbi:ABC transporter substrate-binding protein [Pollutimonas harenae]|uniref:Peptide ABC transporter substrate-binding protein n=1 Tax=Pollutimonas harenae TaxID=657015 RepID=A0A853GYD7_9BURK|nr:ABC transporter substrate-binding protein [Pollutimonas harenae]NYT84790.1 peptide ABC transporter substrate-binding protein [Pollutimonas harenae]TEA72811.1 peptide ABC transporter substrate-binding protein [Pollutimonas harenae]